MASSTVDIASSSPFGCVLRDRNHRDRCRESSVFQKRMKNFVMDHLNIPTDSTTNENNNNAFKASKNNNLDSLCFTGSNHNNNKEKDEYCLASLVSPRHLQLLDRWAAKHAREMVSTLENEAELLAMPNSNNNNDMLKRTYSNSSNDDVSSGTSALGASSLVQMWEMRLNKSNGSKPTTPNFTNSLLKEQNRGGSEAEESSSSSSTSSSDHEPPGNEEPFPDWEFDKIGMSNQCSPKSRFSSLESAESDRVSVADIIKRLTSTKQGQSPSHSTGEENDNEGWSSSVTCSPCRERDCGSGLDPSENKAFLPQITCLPRIRGRQAFHDLLMQLERDRHVELKNLAERVAVSKFTQRGRIQSVLRLRLLQREVAANNESPQKSTASEVNRQPQGSAIMQLRERFSTGADNKTTGKIEVAEPRSPPIQFDASPTTGHLSKNTCSLTVQSKAIHSPESMQKLVAESSVDQNKEEARQSSNTMHQETCLAAQDNDSQEIAEATPSTNESNVKEMEDKVETSNQMAETSYDETEEEEEEDTSNQHFAESCYDEIAEEVEGIGQNHDETSYDWISEISRPRSYWEERRQEWYREMLDTESHNEDIRKLLERRTVSSFLSSDFRDRMDRLMECHRGTQTHLVGIQDEEEDNQALITILQEHLHLARSPREDEREQPEEKEEEEVRRNDEDEEEQKEEEEEEDEHEGETLMSNSYNEAGDYFSQSSSPTNMTTWSYIDNETGDDFDRVASISSPPSQSQSFCQDTQQNSSSVNHHSIEMELIYDLRGQMEQLHCEMSELRKSMKTCMDMQMQAQQSNNQEVHTVKKEEKKSHDKAPIKGNCCICYDMKVDSVLYRCGHMCACLKCANELQWNSGKCPICRAKIVDVVRVYVDF
ncbi:hypothetical protein Lal_00022382 [Lupinus albus]|uniref:Putative aminoacyltransferase, E1 ubiquitin-activating enzyme n=1 Tax=Lupinus albus TaxID=3870 RepID=A0A6A4PA75_LUPAL|nr:putative aminoacyltransferase, E1 ubiquitin-activating enzyme [Lupinus albus]KAF1894888.1 hypothetical protein Lal_00022382 [Lupinus albus]